MGHIQTAVGMYHASELIYEFFSGHGVGPEQERARRRSTLMPLVVTSILGIEVALKALISEQGDTPARTHNLPKLYKGTSVEIRKRIEAKARAGGLNAKSVQALLRTHRNSLQEWRYRDEDDRVLVVSPGDVLLALRSIIEVHQESYGQRVSQSQQPPRSQGEVPSSVLRASSEYARNVLGNDTGERG